MHYYPRQLTSWLILKISDRQNSGTVTVNHVCTARLCLCVLLISILSHSPYGTVLYQFFPVLQTDGSSGVSVLVCLTAIFPLEIHHKWFDREYDSYHTLQVTRSSATECCHCWQKITTLALNADYLVFVTTEARNIETAKFLSFFLSLRCKFSMLNFSDNHISCGPAL